MSAVLTTLASSNLVAQFDGRNGDDHGGGPGFLLFPIIVGLIIYGIINLKRSRRGSEHSGGFGPWGSGGSDGPRFRGPGSAGSNSSARTFLDERFARGEIDSETYLHQVATFRRADEGAWGSTTQPATAQPDPVQPDPVQPVPVQPSDDPTDPEGDTTK